MYFFLYYLGLFWVLWVNAYAISFYVLIENIQFVFIKCKPC